MRVRNSTSKLAFNSGMGSQPSTAPTHHTQSASVLSKTSTPTVVSAAAASQMSIVAFLFQRSESAPAKMLKSTYSAYERMESSAVLSAEPLCSYAQMTSAKLVIELPSAENVCVDHRRRNGPNAVRAGLFQSFGENLNAENLFLKFLKWNCMRLCSFLTKMKNSR